ncbi:MAG TPA: signal peptidase I [Vicinamibacterales bacterium]|nr:signal peptidase I [Vicinamibacterales bacterium]
MSLQDIIVGRHPRRTAVRIGVVIFIAFVTFRWILIPIRTDGISMQPAYEPGRLHFVNRLAYAGREPARGDVVAVHIARGRAFYVKRIIGLPGERIAIVRGQIEVDGAPLDEPYVRFRRPWDMREITLGPREYFVLGDNRGMNAADHEFGGVDRDRIAGKIVF